MPKKTEKVNRNRKNWKEKNHPEVLHQGIFVPKLVPIGRYVYIKMMTQHIQRNTLKTGAETHNHRHTSNKLPKDRVRP